MSSLLSVGTRALAANQMALQTAGNNIANVNTPGYSRQSTVMQTVPGQYTGAGYIGKGVEVVTIKRELSAFLTKQSAMAGATQAGDFARSDKLNQLQDIFTGGNTGLGAAVGDMLNAFSDVATAPTDMTARTVVLTKVDETATRLQTASQRLDDLQLGLTQELTQKIDIINSLAKNMASVNEQIARSQGSGQPANDLLDRRDQLVRDLNQYVQTTSIAADDGTVGIFLAGSQPLVLGTQAATVSLVADEFGVINQKLGITQSGKTLTMDENLLGGGEVAGLLRFQNNDLAEGRNLLGRFTLAITSSMNTQHSLGLDMDGNVGGNLFTPIDISNNVRADVNNAGTASMRLAINDASQFVASDYEINFSSSTTGTVTQKATNTVLGGFTLAVPGPTSVTVEGLSLEIAGTPAAGDRFMARPFSLSTSTMTSEFSSPRALAVASPVAASMGTTNTGTLQPASLIARSNPAIAPGESVVLTFAVDATTGLTTYTRSDDVGLPPEDYNYLSGQAIEATFPDLPLTSPPQYTDPLSGWSLTLQGAPKNGDTVTLLPLTESLASPALNAGNASAMMGLRDMALFDGAALTDGYAALISQIGVRTQSAAYATDVSTAIAANLESDRTGVSGVNLDEEAAKLLQYQQAYQASAKMIQIAQSIFDTLIQTLR